MVDSCIGGKSSINVGGYKNIVGNFYPPQGIVVDPEYISSLSTEKRIAGLCEAVKICFARGDDAFDEYLSLSPSVDMSLDKFSKVIELSLRSKKWFIEVDEFDRNERLLLNFGHTFGHAIEGATSFAVSHGIAVGLGMLAAADFSVRNGVATEMAPRTEKLIRYVSKLLLEVSELQSGLVNATVNVAFDKFSSDKKHGKEFFTAIVPNSKGELERIRMPRNETNRQMIRETFGQIFSNWSA
jgi:3-dehydroquinate synthase